MQDLRRFQTPALFVLPQAPVEVLKQFDERSYKVQVAIDDKGMVTSIRSVEPADAEFQAHLNEAVRFWVFFPEVDPKTCSTLPSTGVVEMSYRRGENEPRVWLTLDTGKRLLETPPPRQVRTPPLPAYPSRELSQGISGSVFVLAAVDPQGDVTSTNLLLGLPPSEGLVTQARRHLGRTKFDPGLAAVRCVAVEYIYKLQP